MELTFVVAVNVIWQLQPSLLHPCKVCDQGRSVGKIKFTRRNFYFFLNWKCWENFEIKDGNRCILTLLIRCFRNLELLRKLKINRLSNDAFCLNLKRCKMRRRFIIIEFSSPDVILKRLFLSYIILYFENGIS